MRSICVSFQGIAEATTAAEQEFRAVSKAIKAKADDRSEITTKLGQLIYALSRLEELLIELRTTDHGDKADILRKINFYAESFYLLAWRTRQAFRHVAGLASFNCPGVRMVRNDLIEHPEKYRGYKAAFYGVGPLGPMMKNPRSGFFPNAREFYRNLLGMLACANAK
ncbi:MAG TPA: hypothetical protein VH765_02975, partial [Xanthobacteraceae bacterium]